jgi:hypothetical protein
MPASVRFTIFRIEPWGNTRVIHGSITGYGWIRTGGQPLTIDGGHMPFEEDTVRQSVLKLHATGAKPTEGFEGGYAEWRRAQGGAFTLTISEAVRFALDTAVNAQVVKE